MKSCVFVYAVNVVSLNSWFCILLTPRPAVFVSCASGPLSVKAPDKDPFTLRSP